MKKIISMIIALAVLCFAFPAFADTWASAQVGMATTAVLKAPAAVAGEEIATTDTGQTTNCGACHRAVNRRPGLTDVKFNPVNSKPLIFAGAVFMHPD